MIRSILMAVGIFLLILGAQSLLVEKVVVKKTPPSRVTQRDTPNQSPFQNAGYRSDSYYQEAKKNGARCQAILPYKRMDALEFAGRWYNYSSLYLFTCSCF